MRLTEKFTSACGGCYEPITNDREVCDKLGQLEDVEDELGIDLILLLELQIKGNFYIKNYNTGKIHKAVKEKGSEIVFTTPQLAIMLLHKSYRLFRYHDEVNYYFKDYGKTWSLKREDLENVSNN